MVILLAAMSAQAGPVTIFSNLNSNPASLYDNNNGWTVSGSGFGPYSPAMAFTPSGTYVLTEIDVAIFGTEDDSIDLALYSDSGGVPGSVLASWTDIPLTFGCCGLDTVTPVSSITLNAGTQYWLLAYADADDPSAMDSWQWNNVGQSGPTWWSQFGASPGTEGAFDVLGDPAVPEPASASLAVCAFALLGLIAKRRRRA
ncbi:MAG: choice-of-anchor R domain-containing protein [Bryobacteraceae bacterium]